MKIQYVIVIHLIRWQIIFYDFKFKWPLQQELEYTLLKPDCHSWWISRVQSGREDTLEEWYAIQFCFKIGKMSQKCMECFRQTLEYLAWIGHQFLSGVRDSRKPDSQWGMIRGVGEIRKSIHYSWLAKGLGLGLLCWGFKGVQEKIPSEDASTLQMGQWHIDQENAPVHNSIHVTNYLTKIGIKTVHHPPYSPCDFWLCPTLRGCRYETSEEMKEAVTKVIDTLT